MLSDTEARARAHEHGTKRAAVAAGFYQDMHPQRLTHAAAAV